MSSVDLRNLESQYTKGLSPRQPDYWKGKARAAREHGQKERSKYTPDQHRKDMLASLGNHYDSQAKEHEAMAATVAKLPPDAWHPGIAREMTGQTSYIQTKVQSGPYVREKGAKQYVVQVHAETEGGKHGIFSSVPLKTQGAAEKLATSLGGPYGQGRPTAIRTVIKPAALAVIPQQRYDVEGEQKFMDRGPAAAKKVMKQASLFVEGPIGQQKHGPVQSGAKGGQFYVTASGKKVYVR